MGGDRRENLEDSETREDSITRSCCPKIMPKINKISVRSGLYKLVGEFGWKENLYYGSIFLCMTLIVIVCFLVINNGGGDSLTGTAAAIYDSGKNCQLPILR